MTGRHVGVIRLVERTSGDGRFVAHTDWPHSAIVDIIFATVAAAGRKTRL